MLLNKKLNENFIFLILYITLLLGFYLNEDFNGGAIGDWRSYENTITKFSLNFFEALMTYDTFGDRHSPFIHIIFSILKKLGLSFSSIRFLNLHLMLLIIFFFYQCLKLKFKNIERKYLKALVALIFFSTTFRSLSIWPDSRLYGILFFILSLKYFLLFQYKNEPNDFANASMNSFFVAISSYFSPNFAVFSIYFFYHFFLRFKISRKIFYIIFINIILALPALYYIFYLDVNFLTQPGTPGATGSFKFGSPEFNFANKILIISSIFFFYLLPIIIKQNLFEFSKKSLSFFLILGFPLFLLCIYSFDYKLEYTGGGIFFIASNLFLKNNIFFFTISFFAIYYVFFKSFKFNNSFLYFLIIISNIQLTIYHKYYDPMILILSFTVLDFNIKEKFFNYKNIFYFYYLYLFFLFSKILKNLYY